MDVVQIHSAAVVILFIDNIIFGLIRIELLRHLFTTSSKAVLHYYLERKARLGYSTAKMKLSSTTRKMNPF